MTTASTMTASYGELLDECVACGGKDIRFWRFKKFQYTGGHSEDKFHIYRCSNCRSGFLNRPPQMQWLQSIYQYSGQALTHPISLYDVLAREIGFPNCTVDAERMARQADRLNRSGNKTALDIGSGFGFYTHALRKSGYGTVSINPGQYENKVFKQLNGNEPMPIMFESFEHADTFGVVMLSQVLEHLLEPDRTIRKVSGFLAQGGILACAVPNFASFSVKLLGTGDNACLWVPEHVNYFTEEGLKALLERNGLRVIKTEQVTRIPYDALSKRLKLQGRPAIFLSLLTQFAQIPFASLMNYFGLGTYINFYAVKV